MAFDFDALKPEAKRAAFAAMDRKPGKGKSKRGALGSGALHKKLKASAQPSSGYTKSGKPTSGDVDTLIANYRVMHGKDPSPAQIAKLRKKRR